MMDETTRVRENRPVDAGEDVTRAPCGLTVGDGIAVAVLLLFILGWLVGWSFLLWWYEEEGNDLRDLGSWDSAVLLLLAAMPCFWATGLIKHIVKGPWSLR